MDRNYAALVLVPTTKAVVDAIQEKINHKLECAEFPNATDITKPNILYVCVPVDVIEDYRGGFNYQIGAIPGDAPSEFRGAVRNWVYTNPSKTLAAGVEYLASLSDFNDLASVKFILGQIDDRTYLASVIG